MMLIPRAGKLGARCLPLCRNYIPTLTQKAQAAVSVQEDEYSETPIYPQIKNQSFAARKEREALTWQEEIQNLPTVEEKLIKINMPRYYGYKVVHLNESKLPYNCLPAIQHYTRTIYESVVEEADKKDEQLLTYVEAIKADVVDALEFAHDYFGQNTNTSELDPMEHEQLLGQSIVEQINRVLINNLSSDHPHLNEVDVDYNPRHEAFWFVGGIEPPKNVVKSKKGREWQKDMANEPVDRLMQYKSIPMLALRHRLQLQTWKNENEYSNIELAKTVPRFDYDPRTLGFTTGYQHGTNIPGHWPGNLPGFGFISYQSRTGMLRRSQDYGMEDNMDALHAHAIQSSFAWLMAQANYNGFNTFSDLTYPMNTQTIITNGKQWSFYEYQLNTLCVSGRQIDENPRANYCRGSNELSLYQDIDEGGKVIGFNDQVLQHLIQFYIKAPNVQRSADELTPYLDPQYKRIADYSDLEKREFLDKTFKHMSSNRPRHLAIPEIYAWEKIYKIDNKTRPLEARRRFFEVFVNPWKRTLDQHEKKYIPKVLRPEGPKSRKKFKRTYYP